MGLIASPRTEHDKKEKEEEKKTKEQALERKVYFSSLFFI